jgi:hypothetical protein
MLRRSIALLLITTLASSGCASAVTSRAVQTPVSSPEARQHMVDYVQRLPIGARVRVDRVSGSTIHGTLMAADADAVVIQRATRVPEAPVSVPLGEITRIQIEERQNMAKAIIIGAAVGAAATFGVFLLLAAALSD